MRTPDPFAAQVPRNVSYWETTHATEARGPEKCDPENRGPQVSVSGVRATEIYIPPHSTGLIGFIETVIRLTRRFCCGV